MSRHRYPHAPQVAVGAIVCRDDKVLLVRRSRPPSEALWAIPGGRVELGETLKEAAEREVREETGVVICAGNPVHAFEIIDRDDAGRVSFHYVIVDLAADYISGEPRAADDASGAGWFAYRELKNIPVDERTMAVLKAYFLSKTSLIF